MKKCLILFWVIFTCGSCTKSSNIDVNVPKTNVSKTEEVVLGKGFPDPYWPAPNYSKSSVTDFHIKKEYYYQLLLNEWLKSVSHQELRLAITGSERMALMRENEARDSTIKILKRHYNVDITTCLTSSMGRPAYSFMIVRANELLWILFSRTSKRAVWYKDNMMDPAWIKAKESLSELRDSNAYTFFLRNLEFGAKYQCPFPQQEPIKSSVFPNGVDSVTACSLAVAAAPIFLKCYDKRDDEMTPIAARLMGDNQEHWLVYTFSTIPDAEEQEKLHRIFTLRHKEGLSLWNMSGRPCYDNLELLPQSIRCSNWPIAVVAVLLSRKTGEVLFMN